MKTHFAAKADDVFANGGHDARKIIASHVRMRLPQDALGSTRINEPVQHVRRIAILEIGRELAVGKRARTTFTKLYVRPGVELSRSKEGFHIVRALLHRCTLLNEKRFEPALRKIPSGEEPGRSCAYYHGRQVGRPKLRNLKRHIGSGWPDLQAFQLCIVSFGSRKQALFALWKIAPTDSSR